MEDNVKPFDLDLDDNSCVAEIAIKAMVAPDDLKFSGHLVYELASRLLGTREELLQANLYNAADHRAKAEVAKMRLEIYEASRWARKHLRSQEKRADS